MDRPNRESTRIHRQVLARNIHTGKEFIDKSVYDVIGLIINFELEEAVNRTAKRDDYKPEKIREIYLDEIERHFNPYAWSIKLMERLPLQKEWFEYDIIDNSDHLNVARQITDRLKSMEVACNEIYQNILNNNAQENV